jgi:hypothetical protein
MHACSRVGVPKCTCADCQLCGCAQYCTFDSHQSVDVFRIEASHVLCVLQVEGAHLSDKYDEDQPKRCIRMSYLDALQRLVLREKTIFEIVDHQIKNRNDLLRV